jgi:hypothetical protein
VNTSTETRPALRETCNRLHGEICAMESAGQHGSKPWHQIKQAFGRALRAHGDAGGSVADLVLE